MPIGSVCSSTGKRPFETIVVLRAAAKLRQTATIENIDYRTARGLDRALFQTLTTSQWVHEHNHLAIVGPTGTGKSWLACALGNKACRDGFSALYKRASRLFADLAQARGEGRLARLISPMEASSPSNATPCWSAVPVPARPIWPSPLPEAASDPVFAVASTTWSTSSTAWRSKPAT